MTGERLDIDICASIPQKTSMVNEATKPRNFVTNRHKFGCAS